jgi:hypothetical protein
LDRIIVDLYKKTRDVPKRSNIISRLFRMAERGMIYNVPGKKGVYSTYELSEEDVKALFGKDDPAPQETAPEPKPSTPAPTQEPKTYGGTGPFVVRRRTF